jgi:hypothetical protein
MAVAWQDKLDSSSCHFQVPLELPIVATHNPNPNPNPNWTLELPIVATQHNQSAMRNVLFAVPV